MTRFYKPNKAARRLLLAAIRKFTLEWKLDTESHSDEALCDVWLAWCDSQYYLEQQRLDWLGFCILGPFSDADGTRAAIRRMVLIHAERCLG